MACYQWSSLRELAERALDVSSDRQLATLWIIYSLEVPYNTI